MTNWAERLAQGICRSRLYIADLHRGSESKKDCGRSEKIMNFDFCKLMLSDLEESQQ